MSPRCRSCDPVPREVRTLADMLERRWTLGTIYACSSGAVRFNEFRQSLPGVSPTTLSERLEQLEKAGIVERKLVSGRPAAMNGTRRSGFTERTAWVRHLQTPLRRFLRTETSSAVLLLGDVVGALAWANVDHSSYEDLWNPRLSITVGGSGISQSLPHWINNGLMTFFFFVVGLELRREFDIGELRERARLTLPVLAGLGGMALPALIFLAFNAGEDSAQAWAAAISTDTAFALGVLALVGARFPARLRVFLLTITVLDDVVALTVIVLVYSGSIDLVPLAVAMGIFALVVTLVSLRIR